MGKVNLSSAARESIEALKIVTSLEAIRAGLLRTTEALVSGQISAQDGKAIAQAAAKRRREIVRGVPILKTKLEKQIETSDKANRLLQTKINMMKTMINAKKHGQ